MPWPRPDFCVEWQRLLCLLCLLVVAGGWAFGADDNTQRELRELRQENQTLKRQLSKQEQLIDSLSARLTSVEQAQKQRNETLEGETSPAPALTQKSAIPGKVTISGQIAAGYFKTGSKGMYSDGEFKLDEARVFLDAQAWEDIYGYVEISPMTREAFDDSLRLGEAYIDWERVLKFAGLDSLLNLRVGRFYIPFGEEYSVRYPMDNPLILHSLSDLWGVDEGVELYGSIGPVQYVTAVQNGGHPAVGDFTSDKSIAGRIACEPRKWLRVSASGMRTGDLSVNGDGVSEMWFGNGFLRSIGNPATTTRFHADLAEADAAILLPRGHLKLAGGAIFYDDNDRAADNHRDIYYYYAEGLLRLTKQFFGAARFSQILADEGFPIIGNGTWPEYFDAKLTENLWRLSLGLGYTPNPNLVFKVEYALEHGRVVGGDHRNHEDFFGALAALRF